MKAITQLSRLFVGLLFIFSGLIKLNDPVGFSFKLDEYFSEEVLNLVFLQPIALEMAVFIVILEVLLGLALLLGAYIRLTNWLLLGMILFFTFLTFYSAYFNKVTDCGCFGDAIPLTPWESFYKDIILSVLIIVIFLNQKYIQPLFNPKVLKSSLFIALVLCAALGNYVLNHLPVKDFRAYAVGKSITEGMKSAEEIGLEPTLYGSIYSLKNVNTGEVQKINSEDYMSDKWWEKKEWEMLSDLTESVVLKYGYEPPVHDFIISLDDEDITDRILSDDLVYLLIAYKIDETNGDAFDKINQFAAQAQQEGITVLGLSASLDELVEIKRHEWQTPFPFGSMDETTLKTIIRSNPGLVQLRNGVVTAKWHYNDIPEYSNLANDSK